MQLSAWVEKRLLEKNPKFYLNFDHLEFRLAEGFWPKFGFSIKGLKLSSKDPCLTQSQIYVSEAYFPIRFRSFIERQVSFSDIKAGQVDFHYSEPLCNSQISETASLNPPSHLDVEVPSVQEQSTRVLNTLRTFIENRFLKELNNSRKWFDSLYFESLYIFKGQPQKEGVKFDNFFIDINRYSDRVVINAQTSYKSEKYFIEDLKPLDLEFTLAQEKIYLQGQGRFKEGEINLHGNLDIPTEEFSVKLESKYFPVGEIIKAFGENYQAARNLKTRLLWFSCIASAQGFIGDYKNLQIQAKNCGLRGEAGKLFTQEIVFYPFMAWQVEPFQADVQDFSLKYVMDLLSTPNVDGLFADLGRLDGTLDYDDKNLRFVGKLKKVEFIFSHRGKKRLQVLREVLGELNWQNQRFSGIINEVNLSGGEFSGVVSFNLDDQFNNGLLQVKVDSLLFNKSVLKLLTDIELTPLQIYGKMSIKDSHLQEWQGYIGLAKIQQTHWHAKTAKIDTKYSPHFWDFGITMEDLILMPGHTFFERINKMFLIETPPEQFHFSKIKINMHIQDQEVLWKEFSAEEKTQGIILSSAGEWTPSQQMTGWITIEKETKKRLPWEMRGSPTDPILSPSIKLLKAIRPPNSTVKIEESMDSFQRQEAFDKIILSRKAKPPKGFTEKLVETAKKWMPDFKKDESSSDK